MRGSMKRSNKDECMIWDYMTKMKPDARLKYVDKMSEEELDRVEMEEGINLRLGRTIQNSLPGMLHHPFWKERLAQHLSFLKENYPGYNKKERDKLARLRLRVELPMIIWYMLRYKKPFDDALKWLDNLSPKEYMSE